MLPVPSPPQLPEQTRYDALATPALQVNVEWIVVWTILSLGFGASGALFPEVNRYLPLLVRVSVILLLLLIALLPLLRHWLVVLGTWRHRFVGYPGLYASWVDLGELAHDLEASIFKHHDVAVNLLEDSTDARDELQADYDLLKAENEQLLLYLQEAYSLVLASRYHSESVSVTMFENEGRLVIEDCLSIRIGIGDGVIVVDKHNKMWLGAFTVNRISESNAYCAYTRIFARAWWDAACESAEKHMSPQMSVVAIVIPLNRTGGIADEP